MPVMDVICSLRNISLHWNGVVRPTLSDVRKRSFSRFALAICAGLLSIGSVAQTSSFVQTNLISDGAVPAQQTDPTLINPWGVSIGSDFWINSPASGLSIVTDAKGVKSFAVTIPSVVTGQAHGNPTGTVFNSDATIFAIPAQGSAPSAGSALFLFCSLDGSISAWNQNTAQAVTTVNNSASKASYTGIALNTNASGTFLLASNFAANTIDVFDGSFAPAHLAGTFADSTIPAGFSAFSVHSIGSKVYVAYAQRNPTSGKQVVGVGLGFVDVFDNNGNLLQRAVSQGNLNAPWGVAQAPAGFGSFAGDILVGNFGDGVINAYDPTSFALVGQIQDATGAPLVNGGLWEIVFGTSKAGDPNTLYLAAGLNGAKDGLFAAITLAPPLAGKPDFSFQSQASTLSVTAGQSANLTLSLAGSNGFSGPVTFSCSGLPAGDACTFSPSTVTLSGTNASTVTMSVAAASAPAAPVSSPYNAHNVMRYVGSHGGMALAFIGPFGILALVGVRRKSVCLRGSLLVLTLAVLSFTVSGCGGSSKASQAPAAPSTPAVSQVVVNATAGAVTHSVNVTLTVQ